MQAVVFRVRFRSVSRSADAASRAGFAPMMETSDREVRATLRRVGAAVADGADGVLASFCLPRVHGRLALRAGKERTAGRERVRA